LITSVIFDFGGTLDTDGIHWSEKFWDIYQRLDIPVAKKQCEAAYVAAERQMANEPVAPSETLLGTLRKQAFHQIQYLTSERLLTLPEDASDLTALIAGESYTDVLRVIDGAKTILATLRERYNLSLVSNFTGNLDTVCRELGIAGYFDIMIDSSVVGIAKPDPEIFRLALSGMAAEPEECVAIGDSYERDIVPAKSLGCRTVWLHGRSWKEPESVELADFTIHSIAELPDLFDGISHFR